MADQAFVKILHDVNELFVKKGFPVQIVSILVEKGHLIDGLFRKVYILHLDAQDVVGFTVVMNDVRFKCLTMV